MIQIFIGLLFTQAGATRRAYRSFRIIAICSNSVRYIQFRPSIYPGLTALLTPVSGAHRRYSTAPVTASILGLATITLWASTTIHVVTMILWQQTVFLNLVTLSDLLWTYDMNITVNSFDHVDVVSYEPIQSCASTVALAINVRLFDSFRTS